ncbi:MAG: prepilin-type N-terminal cleavage/methylation domain-containing protein, partial [Elusimicrobia bacterium]|nr:prepilin-type N-terminal cleavage/methylation domain-containing protein [Elusimicrobiota bacterium]
MNKNNEAFTLIELVMTIVIIVILSSIAAPLYNGYTAKAKYAEGYATISRIIRAEEAYRAEYGNFYIHNYYWQAQIMNDTSDYDP